MFNNLLLYCFSRSNHPEMSYLYPAPTQAIIVPGVPGVVMRPPEYMDQYIHALSGGLPGARAYYPHPAALLSVGTASPVPPFPIQYGTPVQARSVYVSDGESAIPLAFGGRYMPSSGGTFTGVPRKPRLSELIDATRVGGSRSSDSSNDVIPLPFEGRYMPAASGLFPVVPLQPQPTQYGFTNGSAAWAGGSRSVTVQNGLVVINGQRIGIQSGHNSYKIHPSGIVEVEVTPYGGFIGSIVSSHQDTYGTSQRPIPCTIQQCANGKRYVFGL